ncbi:MAG: UbiA family prenyltransferase [Candidatus Poribacteria bacterium]|nr:UbiA family prenyltransferase [Candidatus Poribacteria bacterium]
MSHFKAYLELIRYPLFAIPIVATLPGALIASEGQLTWRVVAALIIAMFGYFAGMIKNDYFHRETDALTNPERPLPSHRLTPKQALVPASIIYALCVLCGFLLNVKAGLLVMALVAISHLYNAIFKAKGILGSLTLPLGIGLLNVFGALVVSGSVPRLVWYAFGATTLYDLGTHITTTFKDISRDREQGITTTPMQLGIRPALFLAAAATILAFVIALLPYWLEESLTQKSYAVWVILGMLAAVITRIPLYLQPNEKNGYFALKGSMIGSILFFPCLIGTQISLVISISIIIPLLLITVLLLRTSRQEV